MKRKKKTLKLNTIRIANMNFIKGGTVTNNDSVLHACQSGTNCPPPPPDNVSSPANPCSDGCILSDGCTTGQPDLRDLTISCTC
ncbi:hypothetical protein [Kordia jejudonensis]|uniref:hypothetical protein n=1 Tax=Kordia jejudonensis TaxID=1348245 RepID=UPI000629B9B5|nr:hypothetical protein [Kordia jejudonensis]